MRQMIWAGLAAGLGAAAALVGTRPASAQRRAMAAAEPLKIPLEVPDPPDRFGVTAGDTGQGFLGAVYGGR